MLVYRAGRGNEPGRRGGGVLDSKMCIRDRLGGAALLRCPGRSAQKSGGGILPGGELSLIHISGRFRPSGRQENRFRRAAHRNR